MSDSEARMEIVGALGEEFINRLRRGEHPSLNEYKQQHPEFADEIEELFPALAMMEDLAPEDQESLGLGDSAKDSNVPAVEQLGDYRIIREAGRGGMGVVYEAEQKSLGRHVALKVLPSSVLPDSKHVRRFEREAKSAAKLHHTNIVPVFGVGEQDGMHYYVMQFIQGLPLDVVIVELRKVQAQPSGEITPPVSRIDEIAADKEVSVADVARSLMSGQFPQTDIVSSQDSHQAFADLPYAATELNPQSDEGSSVTASETTSLSGSFSGSISLPGNSVVHSSSSTKNFTYWQSVANIGLEVADALQYAHEQGILHRDIKPSNLLLDLKGTTWITDFGLAKATDQQDITHTGDILGTLRYMPPEAFDGMADARSDIYSLGLTLYELLAFEPAFGVKDRHQLIKQVTTEPAPRLDKINPAIPRDLVTIVHKSIDRDPGHRYQTAEELRDDLYRFLEDEPIKARRISLIERFMRWSRRNKGLAASLMVVCVLLLVINIAGPIMMFRLSQLNQDLEDKRSDLNDKVAELVQTQGELKNETQRASQKAVAAQKLAAEKGRLANEMEILAKKENAARAEANRQSEVVRENLYYAEMHLAQQAWREHRGLDQMRGLLANWLPDEEPPFRRQWEWFYINSLPYQNLRTLPKSRSSNRCAVTWHVASGRLAEGTADGVIRIWDVDRERISLVIRGPQPYSMYWGVTWLAWSPNGSLLAAGGQDGSVHIWETTSGKELLDLKTHDRPVVSVAFLSNEMQLVACGQDGKIKVVNTQTGGISQGVTHAGSVSSVAWSAEIQRVAMGHRDGSVTISDIHTGADITTLQAHPDQIVSLAWSPDSQQIATTSSNDFFVMIWDLASQHQDLGPLRHSHGITSIAWSSDGQKLATGSMDETIKIWNTSNGQEDVKLRGFVDAVYSLSWGPDDRRLASGSNDGSTIVWTSLMDQESLQLPGGSRMTAVGWSSDGKRLASGSDDGCVRIWDPAHPEEVVTFHQHDESLYAQQFGLVRGLVWSPDGTCMASVSMDGTIKVWNADNGVELFVSSAQDGSVECVAWSPDGNDLAAGFSDGTVHVIKRVRHTPESHVFRTHQKRVHALAWNPGGDRLATASYSDPVVRVWDPVLGTQVMTMEGHRGSVMGLAWSPDGKRLASSSGDRSVKAWDAQTGKVISTMIGHNDYVNAVTWSPDGSRLASAGFDNSVRVWDPVTGAETCMLRGNGFFYDVSWNSDGVRLAAACGDGHVWIWDATLGYERDTTFRALPYIDRAVATGTARGDDLRWYAESYIRGGKLDEALEIVKDDAAALINVLRVLHEKGHFAIFAEARSKAIATLEPLQAAEAHNKFIATALTDLLLLDDMTMWTVLEPIEMTSKGGATLTLQNDGSILASGENSSGDVYTIRAAVDIPEIRCIRLEALPDPSLPGQGPGRHPSGNFQLATFRVFPATNDDGVPMDRLTIADSWASYCFSLVGGKGNILGTMDDEDPRFWHVFGRSGERHAAMFALATPLRTQPGHPLILQCEHRLSDPGINLGRFRLSVSGDPATFDRERKRLAARKITDPWAKLAAAYHIVGDQSSLSSLLKRHPSAVCAIGDLHVAEQEWDQAIAAYSRVITEDTNDTALLGRRAEAYIATEQWDLANADWQRIVELNPDQLQQAFDFFRKAEQWGTAAEFGLRLCERKPDESIGWLKVAPWIVLADDVEAYGAFCKRFVTKFGKSGDSTVATYVLKACLLRVGAIELDQLPVEAFEKQFGNGMLPQSVSPSRWGLRGLLALREGEAELAIRYIDQAQELQPLEVIGAFNQAVLAMSQQELQHPDEAQMALTEASRLITLVQPKPENLRDHDLLMAEILFREAEAKINGKKEPQRSAEPDAKFKNDDDDR